MKFAIIKERKNPPDRRVVFPPKLCKVVNKEFPDLKLSVESSDIRFFKDEEYDSEGFLPVNDISDCDVLLGVKEVPINALIPNKKYFFFSHTIKKASYNRGLLKAVLSKNIELYDHETITKSSGSRLIGFGRYAGIVGAYNGFIAYGKKNHLWDMPKAENLSGLDKMKQELSKLILPNIKVCLTGSGKVANGAKEILDFLNIRQVSVKEYLSNSFDEAVYCKIDVLDYNKRKDGRVLDKSDFYNNAADYESDFMRFASNTDYFIAGHFYDNAAPFLYTREDCKSVNFKIKVVADVSCDIDGPVASTIRPSTIADPIYGYDPQTESEIDFMDNRAIVVMAVDNLPCELPKDASEGFGEMFLEYVIPAFYNNDKDGILERSKMTTSEGKLTDRYEYLQDYVDGKE
jgi:hypothetical protein